VRRALAADAGPAASASAVSSTEATCEPAPGAELPALGEYYKDYFAIGTAIDEQYNQYAATITRNFNSITTENDMKFDALQPTEGKFTFDTADRMVEFATSHNMQVRGHTLVWHNQTPSWVFSGSKEQVLSRMQTHIQTVMQHFQGKVHTWDVVNEAIMDDGSFRGENGGSGWYQALGESYIAEAFRAARKADPTAKLFYNDYANYAPARRQGIYDMLAGLIQAGVPIDGVGLQGHMHLRPGMNHDVIRYQTVEQMETAILMYSSLGLDVQITEMDVSMYVLGETYAESYTTETLTPALLAEQAARYRAFFELFRKHRDVISSVTFWGVVDNNTWLSSLVPGQEDFPLLFDAQQKPKPAFNALVNFCN
jgi:endo-1,4-beta-xylanase